MKQVLSSMMRQMTKSMKMVMTAPNDGDKLDTKRERKPEEQKKREKGKEEEVRK